MLYWAFWGHNEKIIPIYIVPNFVVPKLFEFDAFSFGKANVFLIINIDRN